MPIKSGETIPLNVHTTAVKEDIAADPGVDGDGGDAVHFQLLHSVKISSSNICQKLPTLFHTQGS